jgi:hypothetical protein
MASLILSGATSGSITLESPAVSGTTTLTLPATTGTVLTNASQLVGTGTTTNDSAAAGYVGEYISSTVISSGVSLTTAVFANITSISLTAGDWDVSGVVAVTNPGTTSFAYINYGVSTTSATNGTLGQVGSLTTPSNISAVVDFVTPVPVTRLSLSSTTTVYLVTRASFSVSTASAYGVIRARRIR